jgi:hypothetical protein
MVLWWVYQNAGHYGFEYGVIAILAPATLAMMVLALAFGVCGLTEAGSRQTSIVTLWLALGQLALLWWLAIR